MAKKTDDSLPKAAGRADEFIKVYGPEDGRWRAGLNFGPLGTLISLAEITVEQFEQIAGDELLKVERILAERAAA